MEHVNHPKHYNTGNIEVIQVIEDWRLSFCLGNAVKYLGRAGKKDPFKLIEDVEKAFWYINREIEYRVSRGLLYRIYLWLKRKFHSPQYEVPMLSDWKQSYYVNKILDCIHPSNQSLSQARYLLSEYLTEIKPRN